jgi:hypothetical protein
VLPCLEFSKELDEFVLRFVFKLLLLLHCGIAVVHCFLFHTPLDPNQLSIRSFHRPPLLETRSKD